MTADIAELVALVNARLPEASPYRLVPERVGMKRWGDHYWAITDGEAQHLWQQVWPTEDRPCVDPFIVWAEEPEVALQRILAVERRRALRERGST